MRATPQSEVLHSRLPASSERDNVIELDESATPATAPSDADKGAATFVAPPDRASDRGGNVAGRCALLVRAFATQLACADAEPPHFELRDQRVQGSIENSSQVTGWHGMTEEGLRLTELVVGALRNHELKVKSWFCMDFRICYSSQDDLFITYFPGERARLRRERRCAGFR